MKSGPPGAGDLAGAPGVALSGSLPVHAFAVVKEEDGGLRIFLDDYRTDKGDPIWNSKELEAGAPCDYVKNVYAANPADAELRESVVKWTAAGGEAAPEIPEIEVEFGRPGDYSEETGENGETALRVRHNGPVDITIRFGK